MYSKLRKINSKHEIHKERNCKHNLGVFCRIPQHSKLHSSTQNAQITPDMIRQSAETEELLRSVVDLIHYDCYTNGINKGKIAILKHRIFILFIWLTSLPFSSSSMKAHCVCTLCVCMACGRIWVCLCPHQVIAIRSSLCARLGVQCRWIATFCTIYKQHELWNSTLCYFWWIYYNVVFTSWPLTSFNTFTINAERKKTLCISCKYYKQEMFYWKLGKPV